MPSAPARVEPARPRVPRRPARERLRPSRASSCSMRNMSACSDRSADGWVALSSAISSWMRGSEPSLTAAIAAARRSIARRISPWEKRAAWTVEAIGVLGRDRERLGDLAERLHDEQVAQVRRQVAHELREVAARVRQPLHRQQRGARVALGDRLGRVEDQLGVRHAEDVADVVELDVLAAVGDELLERAERVAEAAGRRAGDHVDRRLGDLDLLLDRHPAQHARDLLERRAVEVEAVAAVDDRGRHLVRLGRGQHEDDVRRRLLERLEERVPGRGREHVRLVEDEDAAAAAHRRERDVLAQRADVVDRVVRRGVHLDHVERGAGDDRLRSSESAGSKSARGPSLAFRAQASSFAIEVLPVPREPTNR